MWIGTLFVLSGNLLSEDFGANPIDALIPGDLVITELWVAPDEGPEWVEILNTSNVDLPHRAFALRRNGKTCSSPATTLLKRGERAVFTSDTTSFRERFGAIRIGLIAPRCWLSLPNSGGALALVSTEKEQLLDSVEWASVPKETPLFRQFPKRSGDSAQAVLLVRGNRNERPSPGFELPRPPHRQASVEMYPRDKNSPVVLQVFLGDGDVFQWKITEVSGKIAGKGSQKGALAERLAIELPPGRTKPLWLDWIISPAGIRGVFPLWKGE